MTSPRDLDHDASHAFRVGLGIDVHAFSPPESKRPLVLGGVCIDHPQGLEGHSDADVVTHAIMDALLGAARIPGACDIGALFPDTDPSYQGADSLMLLKRVGKLLVEGGFVIRDIDCVIVAQAPRITPYREQMRSNIAAALGITIGQIGIKATTTEGLGFEGRKEGISAHAIALLSALGSSSSAGSPGAPGSFAPGSLSSAGSSEACIP